MRRLALLLVGLVAACASPPTSARLTIGLESGATRPESVSVSVFGRFGALELGRSVATPRLPGSLIVILPDSDETVRFSLVGDGALKGGLSLPVHAHAQAEGVIELRAGAPDPDGDGVISAIDNCPTVANPAQEDANGDAPGDACASADGGLPDLAGAQFLVGNLTVGRVDYDEPGIAEAFEYTAAASGSTGRVFLFLDESNLATEVEIGLYADSPSHHPGMLLTSGVFTNPASGRWISTTVPSVAVSAGAKYWIAILAPEAGGQRVQFRDTFESGRVELSAETTLPSLPASWTTGEEFPVTGLAAYFTP